MAIPILAAIGAKVALPIVGKLLGGLLGKAGIGSLLGTVTKFLPLAKNILGSLGKMGLSAMKPPASRGRIANLGYAPPSQGARRPGGMFGGMGGGGMIGRLLGGLKKLMGGTGQSQMQSQLQQQMNSVSNMLNLMSNMQQQMHDIAMKTMQSIRG